MGTITINQDNSLKLVKRAMEVDFPTEGKAYPLRLIPKDKLMDKQVWVKENKENLIDLLQKFGAVLFRDFGLENVSSFYEIMNSFGLDPLEYKERSSPRHEVGPKVYTSTDHPPDQIINMHNENSYSKKWPLKLLFFCDTPSETGGETPIADSRLVLAGLSANTREKFTRLGVMYVRSLGSNLGLDWKEVFGTDDKSVIEKKCIENNMGFEWLDDDRLKLKYTCPAVRRHPITGELSWFNHAFFFNLLSLDPEFLEEILLVMDKEDFPFLSFYGDGSEIEPEVIEEIRSMYDALIVEFKWKKGDLILIDNMLMAHGRNPFQGDRKILVAMAELQKHEDYL